MIVFGGDLCVSDAMWDIGELLLDSDLKLLQN